MLFSNLVEVHSAQDYVGVHGRVGENVVKAQLQVSVYHTYLDPLGL